MIRCNLAVLLAEKNLKITKVAIDTGISRTTLTALSNNYSQGIQFETLDTLCLYLGVSPSQIVSFVPVSIIDISVCIDGLTGHKNETFLKAYYPIQLTMKVQRHKIITSCDMAGDLYLSFDDYSLTGVELRLSLFELYDGAVEMEIQNRALTESFELFSQSFIYDIKSRISSEVSAQLKTFCADMMNELTDFHVELPIELEQKQ